MAAYNVIRYTRGVEYHSRHIMVSIIVALEYTSSPLLYEKDREDTHFKQDNKISPPPQVK